MAAYNVTITTFLDKKWTFTALCGTLEEAENFASRMARSVTAWNHPSHNVTYEVTEQEATNV